MAKGDAVPVVVVVVPFVAGSGTVVEVDVDVDVVVVVVVVPVVGVVPVVVVVVPEVEPDVADAPDNAEMAGSATVMRPAAATVARGTRSRRRFVLMFRCLA